MESRCSKSNSKLQAEVLFYYYYCAITLVQERALLHPPRAIIATRVDGEMVEAPGILLQIRQIS